jgi:hypothetical protein
MLRVANNNQEPLVCKKCHRKFGAIQTLDRHLKKKIPCDRELKCKKSNKEFKLKANLLRHQNRKTPCEPIQGDPTIKVGPDTCIYCRKVFKSKYNVTAHLGVCKIKNGGMEILFDEVKRLKEKVKDLEKKHPPQIQNTTNNIENQTNNNHFGHTFNFNFINFGEGNGVIENILNTKGIQLLSEKFTQDIPSIAQISNRVIDLIGLVFRNPDHKELQGVYVLDLSKTKENAYYHEDGNWILTDWIILRSQLLQKLHTCLIKSTYNKRQDIEKIIKYLFVLGDCGDCNSVKKLTDAETLHIYKDIGEKLKFETIVA